MKMKIRKENNKELNLLLMILTTSISDFFLFSEIITTWQTNSTAHKLKLRLFYKFTHLQAHLVDFHL